MTEEANPEQLSFKEKLKRFQNKDVIPSDSGEVYRRPKGKAITVNDFSNSKNQETRKGTAIHKDDLSSNWSQPILTKQDSCDLSSDYLEDLGDEIKDSDCLNEFCDSPVSEEMLASSDSSSNINVSCSSHRSTKRDIATCTRKHDHPLDAVDAHPLSDSTLDETTPQEEDSSDQALTQPPYPAAPYPQSDMPSLTGRWMNVGSCRPIGFESFCDYPTLSTTSTNYSSHIVDTNHYPSNYMIEPELVMPSPDFGALHSNKDS